MGILQPIGTADSKCPLVNAAKRLAGSRPPGRRCLSSGLTPMARRPENVHPGGWALGLGVDDLGWHSAWAAWAA